MNAEKTAQEQAKEIFDSLNFKVTISEPRAECQEDWPCIAYDIFINNERFEYRLGIGHVNWQKARVSLFAPSASGLNSDQVERIIELQSTGRTIKKEYNLDVAKVAAYLAKLQKVAPKTAEVLAAYCLGGLDAEESFENWCANLGYDSDSRKALRIYEGCTESGKKARRLLGFENYKKLADLACEF